MNMESTTQPKCSKTVHMGQPCECSQRKTKIQVLKTVDIRNATCDWCKEPNKECFTATTKTSRNKYEGDNYKVLEETSSLIFPDWEYKYLYEYEGETVAILNIDICEDCVKQLAKVCGK